MNDENKLYEYSQMIIKDFEKTYSKDIEKGYFHNFANAINEEEDHRKKLVISRAMLRAFYMKYMEILWEETVDDVYEDAEKELSALVKQKMDEGYDFPKAVELAGNQADES
jgi:hypothetical protein